VIITQCPAAGSAMMLNKIGPTSDLYMQESNETLQVCPLKTLRR